MRFCLSTVLVTASSLAVWLTVFGEVTLADVPKQSVPTGSTPASQSNSQAVYVGFGCSASDNTAFSLYSSRELRYKDKTITIPIKWEEVSGQGFCGRTHYLTEGATTNRPLSGGVTISSNFASAVWVFTSPTATDVSIAAYIPADRYAEDLNRLRFPPVLVDRQVEYIIEIRPENPSSGTTKKCLSKTVDQSQYQDKFVELGTCRIDKSERLQVFLMYRDDVAGTAANNVYGKAAKRVVGDVLRFTPTVPKAQQ